MKKTILFILPLTALLIGCATMEPSHLYDGPPKPPQELVRVDIPVMLDVLFIDGQDMRVQGLLTGGEKKIYYLLPGSHSLKLRYSIVLDTSDYDYTTFRSEPMTLEFTGVAGDLVEVFYEPPTEETIREEQTGVVEVWAEIGGQKMKATQQLADEPDASLTDKKTDSAHVVPVERKKVPETAPAAVSGDHLEQLQYWWERASQDERRAFMNWMIR